MMVTLGIYVRRWQRQLRRLIADPKLRLIAQTLGLAAAGFALSAASLQHYAQPLTLALLCAVSGWPAVLIAAGGMLGYLVFWGGAGVQGIVWLALGLPAALILNRRQFSREGVWIMPALAGVIVASAGLAFQIWLTDDTPVVLYILRIILSIFAARLFSAMLDRRDPVVQWLVCGVAVLALAQIRPIPYLGLGYIAAGILISAGSFPAAALAGLALDLAQITPVPMAAVAAMAYFVRLIPRSSKWVAAFAPGMVYVAVMQLCGQSDLQPLPGLILGGVISVYLPQATAVSKRRGETGFAQVRLELAASVLHETREALLEVEEFPIDEEALVSRAVDRACSSCPCRKTCKEKPEQLPTAFLHKPLGNGADLPLSCRKSGRMLQELRRSQEQLRLIRADRDRREEYRTAVAQQYLFLSDYLQSLSDALSRRSQPPRQNFQPEVAVCSASREKNNGDRCFWFAGVECRYYILLCDGMGTGLEAAKDGKTAGQMMKKLLCAGFPPEYALRSVNSFCALQGRAGAVTIDLAELRLDTGRVAIYKWGAAPSYLLSKGDVIKIGTAAPPPGLSVTDGRETVERLSLRKEEMLILVSDGAGGEDSLRLALEGSGEPPGELAARILECSRQTGTDDATVAVVRLNAPPSST